MHVICEFLLCFLADKLKKDDGKIVTGAVTKVPHVRALVPQKSDRVIERFCGQDGLQGTPSKHIQAPAMTVTMQAGHVTVRSARKMQAAKDYNPTIALRYRPMLTGPKSLLRTGCPSEFLRTQADIESDFAACAKFNKNALNPTGPEDDGSRPLFHPRYPSHKNMMPP